jgi:hypothetical protein
MPMPFDPRWLMPGGSLYNVAADGNGTFSVPVQPDGQQQPNPPPVDPPKPPPENTPRPPIFAGVGGMGTMAPMGTTAPVAPPTLATPSPSGRTKEMIPAYGPGASQPSVTQAPTLPIEPAFNPDVREAVRKSTPPGGTAAGTPPGTPAAQPSAMDRLLAMQKDPKFGPAIAALAKSFGAGHGGPAPPAPWRSTMHPGNPGFNQPQGGSQMLQQLMQGSAGAKAQAAWEKQKGQRRREADRYDILGGKS